MTRNILPKSEEMQICNNSCFTPAASSLTLALNKFTTSVSLNTILANGLNGGALTDTLPNGCKETEIGVRTLAINTPSFSSDEDDKSQANKLVNVIVNLQTNAKFKLPTNTSNNKIKLASFSPPFSRIRLNQWHTNEEIFNILSQCNYLAGLAQSASHQLVEINNDLNQIISPGKLLNEWLCEEIVQRPLNGSVFLFDRKRVKNFKKDSFMWKRRKTGGANSVREDRMCLKVNGTDCIYGCYSHSSIMSTFHRRCYWLLDKPDIVLVHYLQTPNGETGECLVYLNSNAIASTQSNDTLNTSNASSNDNQLNKDDLKAELKSMLWPFYFDQNFISENLKTVNTAISAQTPSPNDFIELILGKLLTSAGNGQIQPIRINLVSYLNQSTQDILAKAKLDVVNSSKYSSNMKDELNSLFNKQHIVNNYNNSQHKNSSQIADSPSTPNNNNSNYRILQNNSNSSDTMLYLINTPDATKPNDANITEPGEAIELTKVSSSSKIINDDQFELNEACNDAKTRKLTNPNVDLNNNDNRVQLSISSCSTNGGEKLMIIGNWADLENSNRCEYTMIVNSKKIILNQLNKHVLECTLPRFDSIYTDQNEVISFDQTSSSSSFVLNQFSLKTLIYLYENERLYCAPMPFEIKYSIPITTFSNLDSKGNNTKEQISYKNQLFLLERSLMLSKVYNLSKFDFVYLSPCLQSQQAISASGPSSFEKRMCQLIDNLINHILQTKSLIESSSSDHSSAQLFLDNEHEGKTLLHLCSESGLVNLFDRLANLRKIIFSNPNSEYNLIKNELNLLKLDHHGSTAMMLASSNGHESIALELFKWQEFETGPTQNPSSSSYFHILKSIEEAKKNGYVQLSIKLNDLLFKHQNLNTSMKLNEDQFDLSSMQFSNQKLSNSNMLNEHSDTSPLPQNSHLAVEHSLIDDFHLIENLDDLTSLLTDEPHMLNEQESMPQHAQENIENSDSQLLFISKLKAGQNLILNNGNNQISNTQSRNSSSSSSSSPSSAESSNPKLMHQLHHQSSHISDENDDYHNLFSSFDNTIVNLDENGFDLAEASSNIIAHDEMSMEDLSKTQTQMDQMIREQEDMLNSLESKNSMGMSSILNSSQALPQKTLLTVHSSPVVDDDQDKKIKTLADNIIAAMPHKIKTNSYTSSASASSGSAQQQQTYATTSLACGADASNQSQPINTPNAEVQRIMGNLTETSCLSENADNGFYRPLNMLNRNATSFDDGYDSNYRMNSPSMGCYSSSTRSSLSPSSSLSFQFQQHANTEFSSLLSDTNSIPSPNAGLAHVGRARLIDDSPGDDSTCSSTFHIDSPPSTAEFCQYFHAGSSSAYYKNAIETGFAQLTLTDDEQRELYEAALVIQNAYRRYIQRKKKKIRLDDSIEGVVVNSPKLNANGITQFNITSSSFLPSQCDENSLSRSSSASLSSLASSNSFKSSCKLAQGMNLNLAKNVAQGGQMGGAGLQRDNGNLSDDDENNSSSGEDHKQYEAACVIQKYYRRYKQYENLHKYTEAAVKIQTRYRAYKSTSLSSPKGYQYRGGSIGHQFSGNKLKSHYHHSSIDETSISDCTSRTEDMSPNERRLIGSDLQLNNYHMAHQNQYQKLANQKQIARKLMNIRQSPRFSPALPVSSLPPSGIISTNTQNANNSSLNSTSSSTNPNSQLHHHHHHHHHFHHHFHNKNATDIQQQQSQQQPANKLIDSNQPMYNIPHFRRKMSDIQAPTIVKSNDQFAQLQPSPQASLMNKNNANVIGGLGEDSNSVMNGAEFLSDTTNPDSLNSTSTNNNSINNSFDSDSNFDSNSNMMSPVYTQQQQQQLQMAPIIISSSDSFLNASPNAINTNPSSFSSFNPNCIIINQKTDSCSPSERPT